MTELPMFPKNTASANPGARKFDSGKPMMDLLTHGCPKALLAVGDVLTYGYQKYGGKHGWKELPDALSRYEAAMLRHMLARASGEVVDPESGLRHSAHIAANALFILELEAAQYRPLPTGGRTSQELQAEIHNAK